MNDTTTVSHTDLSEAKLTLILWRLGYTVAAANQYIEDAVTASCVHTYSVTVTASCVHMYSVEGVFTIDGHEIKYNKNTGLFSIAINRIDED